VRGLIVDRLLESVVPYDCAACSYDDPAEKRTWFSLGFGLEFVVPHMIVQRVHTMLLWRSVSWFSLQFSLGIGLDFVVRYFFAPCSYDAPAEKRS
jgi:hypothetical protein